MIVVADTSPLNYLVLIGAVEVLKPLYERIIVPRAVAEELSGTKAPSVVQTWIARPPEWLEVKPDPPNDSKLWFLDPGERSALLLVQLLGADEILIDERDGREEAERRNLRVTGTLGVLAKAHRAGLLNFDESLLRLRGTSFRLSPEVERLVRQRLPRAD